MAKCCVHVAVVSSFVKLSYFLEFYFKLLICNKFNRFLGDFLAGRLPFPR